MKPLYFRRVLCREGFYYTLMVVGVFFWAILLEANLLVLVAGLLSGPLLLNLWLCKRSLKGIHVSRRVVRTVTAGQALPVDIQLDNRNRRSRWAITVQDRMEADWTSQPVRAMQPRLFFTSLPAGQHRRLTYRILLPQRGRYRLGPLRISSRFPFGLISARQWIRNDTSLLVYPKVGHLSSAWQRRYFPVPQGTTGSRRAGRAPGDFYAVRQWQPGDSSRWVHWRRSVRQGQLIVRQFEQPSDKRLILVVDLWQPAQPKADDLQRVELIVSFAATVVADLCHRPGFHLRLVMSGTPPQTIGGPTNAALQAAALDRLAVARASHQVDESGVWQAVGEKFSGESEIVVVSPRAGTPAAQDWSDSVPANLAGHWQMIGPLERRFSEYFKAG
jgi:uncharacterized protein (DUF58 family)